MSNVTILWKINPANYLRLACQTPQKKEKSIVYFCLLDCSGPCENQVCMMSRRALKANICLSWVSDDIQQQAVDCFLRCIDSSHNQVKLLCWWSGWKVPGTQHCPVSLLTTSSQLHFPPVRLTVWYRSSESTSTQNRIDPVSAQVHQTRRCIDTRLCMYYYYYCYYSKGAAPLTWLH